MHVSFAKRGLIHFLQTRRQQWALKYNKNICVDCVDWKSGTENNNRSLNVYLWAIITSFLASAVVLVTMKMRVGVSTCLHRNCMSSIEGDSLLNFTTGAFFNFSFRLFTFLRHSFLTFSLYFRAKNVTLKPI